MIIESPKPTDASLEEGRPAAFQDSVNPALASAPILDSVEPWDGTASMAAGGSALASYPSAPPTPHLGSAAAGAAALSGASSVGTGLSGRSKQQQLLDAIAVIWEIPYDKINLGDMIGKGSYGKVKGRGWVVASLMSV